MSYLINRNVAATALNEAQIEFDVNYRGLGEAKKIIDSLPTVNAIVIPDNATNGEIYEKIFGYADEETKTVWNFVEDDYKPLRKNMFSKTWWNAPYKKGENK